MMSFRFRRGYLRALIAGLGTFLGMGFIDALLARAGLRADVWRFDDVLLGLLVAVFVLSLELHHQRELRRQAEKIAIMQEMNHHVRNALQVIVYAAATTTDQELAKQTRTAIDRIEWALREVLPGEAAKDAEDRAATAVPSQPAPPSSPAP